MLRKRKHAAQLIDHILLVVLLFLMVYPLFMAVWCSFKSTAEFNISKWYPTLPLNFENVAFAVNELWIYILNTVFVGGEIVVEGGRLLTSDVRALCREAGERVAEIKQRG